MPSSSKYAPTAWVIKPGQDVTLPSGQLALLKNPGVQQLISAGILESTDTLSTIVNDKHIRRVKGKPSVIDGESLIKDPKNMLSVMRLVDVVAEHMVIEPHLTRPIKVIPLGEAGETKEIELKDHDRVEDVLYTDMVPFEDRMFIFAYALGGNADIEQFREKLQESMGSLAPK
jgi:hypothetical protein